MEEHREEFVVDLLGGRWRMEKKSLREEEEQRENEKMKWVLGFHGLGEWTEVGIRPTNLNGLELRSMVRRWVHSEIWDVTSLPNIGNLVLQL